MANLDLMFDSFDVGKVLVIAPLRVSRNVWPEERETWEHASFLRMSVMVGSAKQRKPHDFLSADQRDGTPLQAKEIYVVFSDNGFLRFSPSFSPSKLIG